MLFTSPMILHSRQPDGRHWLTSLDIPPLQIWPVAANHCRAGQFFAKLLAAKLAHLGGDVPEVLKLTRKDVAEVPTLSPLYPELKNGAATVQLRLVSKPGPSDDDGQDDDMGEFITPEPLKSWKGGYDEWIVDAGRKLGVDVPVPCGPEGYDIAMKDAANAVQKKVPSLRKRFLAGMDGLNLGLKIALTTRKGGKEYVWLRVSDWSSDNGPSTVLESQPRDCKGFKLGQKLQVSRGDILDYCIGGQAAGVVEAGLTQRIAEDFGLILPP